MCTVDKLGVADCTLELSIVLLLALLLGTYLPFMAGEGDQLFLSIVGYNNDNNNTQHKFSLS